MREGRMIVCLLLLFLVQGQRLRAGIKYWDGAAGDGQWMNPLNWGDKSLPGAADTVWLDHRLLKGNYQVILPASAETVHIAALWIFPQLPDSIEVLLPRGNTALPGLQADGPGYGLIISAAGKFINSSGISSGSSLLISDSIQIRDGGHFIMSRRGTHAATIVQILSSAPGTERGIFEFDMPVASSTLSLSNRIFGTLRLSSQAHGGKVNYTASGTKPLVVRGDLEIGTGVNMQFNFGDSCFISGDLLLSGDIVNLSYGSRTFVLAVSGQLYQSPGSLLTETGTAEAYLLLQGTERQKLDMRGKVGGHVGFILNNPAGLAMTHDLELPYSLELQRGLWEPEAGVLLSLDTNARMMADSLQPESWITGPLLRKGLNNEGFLFPVGSKSAIRWLWVDSAIGDCQVAYFAENPHALTEELESGIDHLSTREYWSVTMEGNPSPAAAISLSFDTYSSGSVTDLKTLLAARLDEDAVWQALAVAKRAGTAGDKGFVQSQPYDYAAGRSYYLTLASSSPANPLPLGLVSFTYEKTKRGVDLVWQLQDPPSNAYALLERADENLVYRVIDSVSIHPMQSIYRYPMACWSSGIAFFRIRIKTITGEEMLGPALAIRPSQSLNSGWLLQGPDASGFCTVQWSKSGNRLASLWLMDMQGRCLRSWQASPDPVTGIMQIQLPPHKKWNLFAHRYKGGGERSSENFNIEISGISEE